MIQTKALLLMLVFFYVGDIHGAEIQRKNVDVITYLPFRHGAPLDWEDVRLPTREGVYQRLLIARGANAGNKAVILFMGGKGRNLTKRRRGRLKTNRNFLVRSAPLFARAGFVAAMAGLPSDRDKREGMIDDFRGSQEHHADIRAAVDFLVSEGARDVFLIGTSRGSMSVAYLASVMKHLRVKGYVLTATPERTLFYINKIKHPVLMVHNIDDECKRSSYQGAQSVYYTLGNIPKKKFIALSRGSPPKSKPCRAMSAHGFLGIERKAVNAIVDWMKGF